MVIWGFLLKKLPFIFMSWLNIMPMSMLSVMLMLRLLRMPIEGELLVWSLFFMSTFAVMLL